MIPFAELSSAEVIIWNTEKLGCLIFVGFNPF